MIEFYIYWKILLLCTSYGALPLKGLKCNTIKEVLLKIYLSCKINNYSYQLLRTLWNFFVIIIHYLYFNFKCHFLKKILLLANFCYFLFHWRNFMFNQNVLIYTEKINILMLMIIYYIYVLFFMMLIYLNSSLGFQFESGGSSFMFDIDLTFPNSTDCSEVPYKRFKCKNCSYSTDLAFLLKRHYLTHTGERLQKHACEFLFG